MFNKQLMTNDCQCHVIFITHESYKLISIQGPREVIIL